MANTRAQLSIETMIIYGLVILVTLSVIGGLLYFDILNVGSYLPEQCDISGNDFSCQEWGISTTANTVTLGIRNTGQRSIEITSMQLTDEGGIFFSGATDVNETDIGSDNNLAPGELRAFRFDDESLSDFSEGQTLRGSIDIEYKYADGVVNQVARGTVRISS